MKILFIVAIFSTCLISQDAGYKLYKDGDIESALEYYKALIQLDNDDISQEDILYNIGTIYSNMDSTSEAGSIFQQAYHDSLDFSSDLSYNYGNVLYRNEQLDKSLEAYKNTLLKDPNDSDARKNYEFVKNKIKKNKNMEKQQDQNQDSKDNEYFHFWKSFFWKFTWHKTNHFSYFLLFCYVRILKQLLAIKMSVSMNL